MNEEILSFVILSFLLLFRLFLFFLPLVWGMNEGMNDDYGWLLTMQQTDSHLATSQEGEPTSEPLPPKMKKKDSKNYSNSTYTNGVVYPAISPCSASSFFVYVIYISFLVEFGDTRAG